MTDWERALQGPLAADTERATDNIDTSARPPRNRQAVKIMVATIEVGIGLILGFWALSKPPGDWNNFTGWLQYNSVYFCALLFLAVLGAGLIYRVVAKWAASVPSGREGEKAGP